MKYALLAVIVLLITACPMLAGNTCTPVTINRTLADAEHDTGTGFNVSFTMSFNGARPSTYLPLDDNRVIHAPGATSMTLEGVEDALIADYGLFGGCPATVTWNFVLHHAYTITQDGVYYTSFGWEQTANYNVGNKQNEQITFGIPLNGIPMAFNINPGHTYIIVDELYAQVGFVSYSPASYQTAVYKRQITVVTD